MAFVHQPVAQCFPASRPHPGPVRIYGGSLRALSLIRRRAPPGRIFREIRPWEEEAGWHGAAGKRAAARRQEARLLASVRAARRQNFSRASLIMVLAAR